MSELNNKLDTISKSLHSTSVTDTQNIESALRSAVDNYNIHDIFSGLNSQMSNFNDKLSFLTSKESCHISESVCSKPGMYNTGLRGSDSADDIQNCPNWTSVHRQKSVMYQ